jgi:selenocysteine lyase/cysteine desulfurase
MGTSPLSVEEATISTIKSVNSNLGYGGGEEVRNHLAALMCCKGSEISLTHNTTEGINVAAWGLPLKKGDEILLTTHEHVGNAMPWINRAQHHGLTVRTFQPAATAQGILDQLDSLYTKKTRVVSVPHVSCTIGQLFPIDQICAWAKTKGIFSIIDGAHGAGALTLDMNRTDPDCYITCGHKWLLGPKGTGFFYVPERMFDVIKPVFAGAYTDRGYDITVSPATFEGYATTAHRYDYGTQNSALRIGLSAAVAFHQLIGPGAVQERIFHLNHLLYTRLAQMGQIELISPAEEASQSMMLGFRHKKLDYAQVAAALMKHPGRYRIRQVPESGLNSLRVSTHIYNSPAQIEGFAEALNSL